MKKIFIIYSLIFISCDLFAQDLITQSAGATKSQKFIIPEKLWKTECQGMAQNANLLSFPLKDGTLGVMFTRKDTIHYPFIFVGNICDLVKGNNNSTVYIGAGKALIKPCSGSDEKDIEITSQGLNFIYHTGIGLEYESGKGTIHMFDKSYKLPINEGNNGVVEQKQPVKNFENGVDKQKQPVTDSQNITYTFGQNQSVAKSQSWAGTIKSIIVGLEGGNKYKIVLKEYPDELFYLKLEDAIKCGIIVKTGDILNTSATEGMKVRISVADSWINAIEEFKGPVSNSTNISKTSRQNQSVANTQSWAGTIKSIVVGLEGGNKYKIVLKEYPDETFYLKLEDAIQYGIIVKTGDILNTSAAEGKKVRISVADSWVKAVEEFNNQQEAKINVSETQGISKEKVVGEKIIPGLSMEDVISLLFMGNVVNRDLAGGLYIGMGVFPKSQNEKSSYTGNASLDGYDIVFEKGKVISTKVVTERLGSKKANFSYTIK